MVRTFKGKAIGKKRSENKRKTRVEQKMRIITCSHEDHKYLVQKFNKNKASIDKMKNSRIM